VIFILSIPNLGLVDVSHTLEWFFLFLPNFDLGQALGDMYVNFVIKSACEVRSSLHLVWSMQVIF
jgi:hypothetical protein